MSIVDNYPTLLEGGDFRAPEPVPALELDTDKYKSAVADLDLSEEQKAQLLATLWSILQNLVQLGFSVADADICGSIFGDSVPSPLSASDAVESTSINDEEADNG